ncbi:MAG: hypothetical protein JW862_08685 [Anaerolineales bacterium]|nr:hypothetical protein [Anaerolineales bacterium]
MRTIRASEIGSYLYCRRAWWYAQRGVEPANLAELAAGTDLHQRHGRRVVFGGLLQSAGYLLMLVALILLAATIVEAAF